MYGACFLFHPQQLIYKITTSNRSEPRLGSSLLQVSFATIRCVVDAELSEKVCWEHTAHLKGKASFVQGSVTGVTAKEVQLAGKPPVPYDYLVIASGTVGASPWAPGHTNHPKTRAERVAWFRAEAEKLAAAKSVLIVGGGVVGCELAGEVCFQFPFPAPLLLFRSCCENTGPVSLLTLIRQRETTDRPSDSRHRQSTR